ncbi:MAG TPA: hypothetical protein VE844_04385 [Gammaproteobacteria bacterium]|nr:hypothetical protein [Gammaproteobacteria bacterium]
MQELLNGIQASFIGVIGAIIAFLPNLLAAIVLIIVGWLLGKLLGAVVTRVLRVVRFNEVADRAEIDTFLEKAGVRAGPSAVVGGIVRWAVYLVFFLAAFTALGLPQVSVLINSLIAYLPKVVLAVIVLLVGALAGKVMAGIVRGTLGSMGMGNPDLFANVARFAIIAFAVIAALDILEIAPTVVGALWIAFLALIVGSVALAFGLGGREAASHLMLGRMLRAEVEPGVEVTAGAYRKIGHHWLPVHDYRDPGGDSKGAQQPVDWPSSTDGSGAIPVAGAEARGAEATGHGWNEAATGQPGTAW